MSLRFSALVFVVSLISAIPGQAQSCAKTPSGVVSWWPAEVSTEDTVGSNDGTLQDNAAYAAGKVGMAFDLDGAFDHVLVPDDPSVNLQEFSVEVWVQVSNFDNLFIFTKSGSTGNFGYELGIDPQGRPRFTINGGLGAADIRGPSPIADGTFHHLIATYRSPEALLFLDGVLVARGVETSAVTYEADSDLYIGRRQLGGIPGYWPGSIDEPTLYSRVLCGAEVKAIFDADSEGKCDAGAVVECPIFVDDFNLGDTLAWALTIP